jgi:TRAP-type C4-dicarboxylate transport system substrate-binding protein
MLNRRSILVGGAALAAPALAQSPSPSIRLRLNSIAPKTHFFTHRIMQHWQDEVARATQGRIAVEATAAPLGGMPQAFDLARTGVADVSPGDHAPIAGRFEVMRIINTPFMGGDAARMSVSLWRTYQKMLAGANEHAGAQLLSLWTSSPSQIYSVSKPITRIEDFQGLKVLVSGATASRICQLLGAVVVSAPISQFYDLVSRGVIDATMTTRTAIVNWNVIEHIKHYLEVPGGLFYTSQFLIMNQSKWNGLTEADRAAINSVSGETQSRFAGTVFAEEDLKAEAKIKSGGVGVTLASPAFIAELEKRVAPIVEDWIASAKAKGVDGQAAIAMLRQGANA